MRFVKVSALALTAALGLAGTGFAQTAVTPAAPGAAATAPAIVIAAPEGYVFTEVGSITADDLKGVNIYDAEGKDVGEIADLQIGTDNAVSKIITDVGGFLGMGEHRVALDPSQIQVYKNADNDLRAYVTLTKDELKALPKFEAN
ncbi:PRC-barrel domain-containing protein [Falsigemmobacter intermedius]|uniref:PRC-barrel domain containing protein n=1 Tax=Falsigemmobacter intermedius TaxID=1553448 RepID=A0A3S3UD04_9RHOB|nr:PRC-barrel domain-containing protein [Falsigemmobacter intermedius]RWY41555.1 PRC-barrel domain containing protein [Falsigemmobacter intermedius]